MAAALICMMALFGLAGCGSSSEEAAPTEETTVEETTTAATTAATTAQETQAPANGEIGEDQALKIALEDAGFAESDVTLTNVHLDMDDGRTEYDVEFHKDNVEYDYSIDAYSGDILEKSSETDND